MQQLSPLSPVPHKIAGNRVIISQEIFSQLVEYTNTQTIMINNLMVTLQNLTNTINYLIKTEADHYATTAHAIDSVQMETNESLEKLQNQVSTLAKSISIFLGGE